MMVHLRFVDVEQDLTAAFSMHDARGMGQITPQRLRSVVAQIGENWTENDVTVPSLLNSLHIGSRWFCKETTNQQRSKYSLTNSCSFPLWHKIKDLVEQTKNEEGNIDFQLFLEVLMKKYKTNQLTRQPSGLLAFDREKEEEFKRLRLREEELQKELGQTQEKLKQTDEEKKHMEEKSKAWLEVEMQIKHQIQEEVDKNLVLEKQKHSLEIQQVLYAIPICLSCCYTYIHTCKYHSHMVFSHTWCNRSKYGVF